MGKVTGFMEYERLEEGYAPVQTRLKHHKEFVIGLKADSPTSVPNDCIFKSTALLRGTMVFIATPTS